MFPLQIFGWNKRNCAEEGVPRVTTLQRPHGKLAPFKGWPGEKKAPGKNCSAGKLDCGQSGTPATLAQPLPPFDEQRNKVVRKKWDRLAKVNIEYILKTVFKPRFKFATAP